jgi:hypothetical protein
LAVNALMTCVLPSPVRFFPSFLFFCMLKLSRASFVSSRVCGRQRNASNDFAVLYRLVSVVLSFSTRNDAGGRDCSTPARNPRLRMCGSADRALRKSCGIPATPAVWSYVVIVQIYFVNFFSHFPVSVFTK